MVVFVVIDFFIFVFFFGIMFISVYFESVNMFSYLGKVFSWKSWGGKDFLCSLCVFLVLCSVFFINDMICVVLIGFVLKICKESNFFFFLFFLVLFFSVNIGFVVIFIGNF